MAPLNIWKTNSRFPATTSGITVIVFVERFGEVAAVAGFHHPMPDPFPLVDRPSGKT